MKPLLTTQEMIALSKAVQEADQKITELTLENEVLNSALRALNEENEALRKALKYMHEAHAEDGEFIKKLSVYPKTVRLPTIPPEANLPSPEPPRPRPRLRKISRPIMFGS
jgi:predicted nuclease with TOPRIM domain